MASSSSSNQEETEEDTTPIIRASALRRPVQPPTPAPARRAVHFEELSEEEFDKQKRAADDEAAGTAFDNDEPANVLRDEEDEPQIIGEGGGGYGRRLHYTGAGATSSRGPIRHGARPVSASGRFSPYGTYHGHTGGRGVESRIRGVQVPPMMYINDQNRQEVLDLWALIAERRHRFEQTDIFKYLSLVCSTAGNISMDKLIKSPADIMRKIDAFSQDLPPEIKARVDAEVAAKMGGAAAAAGGAGGALGPPGPAPIAINLFGGGGGGGGSGSAAPRGAGRTGARGSLSDMAAASQDPYIKARMEMAEAFKNKQNVMDVISSPEIHGQWQLLIKDVCLVGWEEDALATIKSNTDDFEYLGDLQVHHYMRDDTARRHFARLVGKIALEGYVSKESGTLDKATERVAVRLKELVQACRAVVWKGQGSQRYLVYSQAMYDYRQAMRARPRESSRGIFSSPSSSASQSGGSLSPFGVFMPYQVRRLQNRALNALGI